MKLTVTRNDLWKGIDTVLDVVPSKPALPILSNICMRATEDGLYLSATDLDLSVTTHIQAKIQSTGSITVPARTFADITREWPETELSIVVELQYSSKILLYKAISSLSFLYLNCKINSLLKIEP